MEKIRQQSAFLPSSASPPPAHHHSLGVRYSLALSPCWAQQWSLSSQWATSASWHGTDHCCANELDRVWQQDGVRQNSFVQAHFYCLSTHTGSGRSFFIGSIDMSQAPGHYLTHETKQCFCGAFCKFRLQGHCVYLLFHTYNTGGSRYYAGFKPKQHQALNKTHWTRVCSVAQLAYSWISLETAYHKRN